MGNLRTELQAPVVIMLCVYVYVQSFHGPSCLLQRTGNRTLHIKWASRKIKN